jgi:hypothetical protein
MTLTRSSLFLIVAFVLVLFAVISYASSPFLGVNPMVWFTGGIDSFILSFLVP